MIYEKETTAKLLEFKIKYLVSYATLMRNYFVHMNFEEIISDLTNRDDDKGKKILVVSCMIVGPNDLVINELFILIIGLSYYCRRNHRRACT